MASYKLSALLKGHDADVRAVRFPSPDTIVSASRDNTVRIWRKTSEKPPAFEGSLVLQGQEFINSVAYVGQCDQYPDGLVVSGGKDSIIDVRKPTAQPSDNAERLLIGHAHNVCTLDVAPNRTWLVSGGWDGQARVWKIGTWETELVLHHDVGGSVLVVLAYNDSTVITGCADERIRVFDLSKGRAGEVIARLSIHTPAVVRAICKFPSGLAGHPSGADFASAGNDGVIRLWKLDGTQLAELRGHDSFIYSLACLPSAELVSSGEDRTLRIWRNTECVQTITHPAISVWTVAVCPNGDIVSGASDFVVRVFTRNEGRRADAETMALFEQSVQASAIPQQQLGGSINKEKLDPPEWLQTRAGTKEGQVKMIREANGSVGAYTWSTGQQEWINVGTVVDSAGSSGRKVMYEGKEYDFVFDVDIEDGKPPLKLPFNLSENVYERATKFLNDNNLPTTYLDNVANFITKNTKGASIGQSSDAPGADPFGSENRYRPGDQARPKKKKPSPDQDYLFMTNGKIEAAHQKLLTTNKNLINSGHKDVAMNPSETRILEDLVALIGSTSLDPRQLAALELPVGSVPLLIKLTSKWPYGDRLAALDLLRLVAATPAILAVDKPGTVVEVMLDGSFATDGAIHPNNVMMALRAVGNLFITGPGRACAVKIAKTVIDGAARIVGLVDGAPAIGAENRNLQVALATVLFDYFLLAYKDNEAGDKTSHVDRVKDFARILGVMLTEQRDAETVYRALRALELVVAMDGVALAAAKALGAEDWVRVARAEAAEPRVAELAEQCLSTLSGR